MYTLGMIFSIGERKVSIDTGPTAIQHGYTPAILDLTSEFFDWKGVTDVVVASESAAAALAHESFRSAGAKINTS
jgi:hypothetical protein